MRIEVQGLTKRFGAMAAVSEVSLSIQEGELFTLLGPSGCGKTTLLRLIAGFYAPDAGEIRFDGHDTTGLGGASNMRVYPPKGFILVTARGPNSRPRESDDNYVGVWSINDNGDVPPRWTIGGPQGMLRQVRGVDLDPKNKSVIVSDKYLNGVMTYYFPEIF